MVEVNVKYKRGFTLIELMILVVIISTVSGVAFLLPISVERTKVQAALAFGQDNYWYDSIADEVKEGSDGKREFTIYPNDEDEAAGVYGLVKICGAKTLKDIRQQILIGIKIHADNVTGEGCSISEFVNLIVIPEAYLPAKPGISASVGTPLEAHVGDIVIVFVHNSIEGDGANARYILTQPGFAIGRLMVVDLEGNPKRIVVQEEPSVLPPLIPSS